MTTKDEALQVALDALKLGAAMYSPGGTAHDQIAAATAICREALAQKYEQEAVAWRWLYDGKPDSERHFPMPPPDADVLKRAASCEFPRTMQLLYTAPPKRKPLTDGEIHALSKTMVKGHKSANWLCRAIEAAHGIGVEHDTP